MIRRALYILAPLLLASSCAPFLPQQPAEEKEAAIAKHTSPAQKDGGKYYLNDGPPDVIPEDLAQIPDASPKAESVIPATTRPYTALGKKWFPNKEVRAHRERGIASWYGRRYHGRPTASGEIYDMFKMTAAHPVLAIPSYARVTRTDTGESVIVRINDRGPFLRGRVIDLSFAAAHRLQFAKQGSAEVIVEAVLPDGAVFPNSDSAKSVPLSPDSDSDSNFNSDSDSSESDSSAPQFVYIQSGAFAAEANAKNLQLQLQNKTSPKLNHKIYFRDDLYLVLTGPYPDEESAGEDDRNLCAAGWCGFLTRAP